MKTKPEVERYIAQMVEEITLGQIQKEAVSPHDRVLGDLGLDSLDYATILVSCERWMEIRVREDGIDWSQIATVSDLAGFLTAEQQR